MHPVRIFLNKLGFNSWKAFYHLIIGEIIVNGLWALVSWIFKLETIREIGFLVVFVFALFAIAWYLPKLNARQVAISDNSSNNANTDPIRQEAIAENLSFIQKLLGTYNRLVRNIHFNSEDSAGHMFIKFCEEPDVRSVQSDLMAKMTIRLIQERFKTLTFKVVEEQNKSEGLKPSKLTDENIRIECASISYCVREYRQLIDEWFNFQKALVEKGVNKFWHTTPWSVKIHRRLADDYDELMRLVSDLRSSTPRRFQDRLPSDKDITKFPRASILS